MTPSDLELLQRFTCDRAQDAFTELVQRHVNLVYSAALRQVRSPQLAEEIAQSVFADLARDAAKLKPDTVLVAWLHAVTRRTAVDVIRKESRRQMREQLAYEMNITNAPDASWQQIEPLLDEAVAELDETDRAAVLLRFFENKSLRDVGQQLGVSDDAAQKRVSRAVERLREFFAKRGVTVGTGGLVVVITANAVQAAPVGLAVTISAAALAGIAATTSTFMKIVIGTKLKLVFATIVAAGLATAFIIQQQNQDTLRSEKESLQKQIMHLQMSIADLTNRITAIGEANQLSGNQFSELLKLRGETGVLRRQLDELAGKNRALQKANIAAVDSNLKSSVPQIHIKARFLTIPKDMSADWYDSTRAGILTDKNFQIALKELHSRNGVETLAEPEVTSTSGRQVQMRATQIISVVTNFCFQETNGTSSIIPQTGAVETGPMLDVMPRVLPDGYSIELPVIASTVDFLGYTPSTNTTPAYNSVGQEIDVPTVLPQFRVQSTTNLVNLFDNQTLVFGLKDTQVQTGAALTELDGSKLNSPNRRTLVFVTATIIDPVGNRVHEDGSYTNIPPQSVSQ